MTETALLMMLALLLVFGVSRILRSVGDAKASQVADVQPEEVRVKQTDVSQPSAVPTIVTQADGSVIVTTKISFAEGKGTNRPAFVQPPTK